jgi:hypothetical protein
MSVCFDCCGCQVGVSATSWSLVQRSPTDCGASLCGSEKLRERGGPAPRGGGGAFAPETSKQIFTEHICFVSPLLLNESQHKLNLWIS